jgi:hypothetical protein
MAKVTSNIGELNARTFVPSFRDDGVPTQPSTVHWRITCPDYNDSEIVAWTSATVTVGIGVDGVTTIYYSTIAIPASAHAMQTTLDREQRLFIVSTDKDLDTEHNEEWLYYVEARGARS